MVKAVASKTSDTTGAGDGTTAAAEMKEKQARVEDALNAARAAVAEGIVSVQERKTVPPDWQHR
jgi:chaperonin GroEL (HSP60 family)